MPGFKLLWLHLFILQCVYDILTENLSWSLIAENLVRGSLISVISIELYKQTDIRQTFGSVLLLVFLFGPVWWDCLQEYWVWISGWSGCFLKWQDRFVIRMVRLVNSKIFRMVRMVMMKMGMVIMMVIRIVRMVTRIYWMVIMFVRLSWLLVRSVESPELFKNILRVVYKFVVFHTCVWQKNNPSASLCFILEPLGRSSSVICNYHIY